MKYDTIEKLFTAICDPIRNKKNTTDLIKHQDIPESMEECFDIIEQKTREETKEKYCVKNTVGGESVLITDGLDEPVQNLKVFGKSWQNTISGSQLFDTSIITSSHVSVKDDVITINSDLSDVYLVGAYSTSYPILFSLTKGDYSLAISNSNVRVTIYYVLNDALASIDSSFESNNLTDDVGVVGIRVRSVDGASLQGVSFTIMFNKGTTKLPWEPYIGEIPAPNPNYIQEVYSTNKIGENLFNKITSAEYGETLSDDGLTATCKATSGATYVNQFLLNHEEIPLKAGITYYLSVRIRLDSGTLLSINTIRLKDINGNNIKETAKIRPNYMSSNYQLYKFSFTPTEDIVAKSIYVQGYQADNAVCTITDIILSTNPNATQSIEHGIYGGNLVDQTKSTRWTGDCLKISYANKTDRIINIPFMGKKGEKYFISFNVLKNTTEEVVSSYFPDIPQYLKATKNGVVTFTTTLVGDVTKFGIYISDTAYKEGAEVEVTDVIIAKAELPYEAYIPNQQLIAREKTMFGGIPIGNIIPSVIADSPIHMSGVYWDKEEEQYYISDTIEYGRNKRVQRIIEGILDGTTVKGFANDAVWHMADSSIFGCNVLHFSILNTENRVPAMCDRFTLQKSDYRCTGAYLSMMYFASGSTEHFSSINAEYYFDTADGEGFKKFFSEHPTKIYAILETPIEYDLTDDEEIAQYKALMMNHPNTTILNDSNAFTEVEYIVDADILEDKLDTYAFAVSGTFVPESDTKTFEMSGLPFTPTSLMLLCPAQIPGNITREPDNVFVTSMHKGLYSSLLYTDSSGSGRQGYVNPTSSVMKWTENGVTITIPSSTTACFKSGLVYNYYITGGME